MPHHAVDYEWNSAGFENLMPYRVGSILMVASPYDSFLIADDDRLTEVLFSETFDTHLRATPPKTKRVSTAEEAVGKLSAEKFDLIIAMIQIGDTDMNGFALEIRKTSPGTPMVLLSFNMQDVMNLSAGTLSLVDRIFLWHGDTRIFSSIISLIEDEKNFEHDSKVGVQAVLLVEDSVRFYSLYLPIIYYELMKQTQIVMADELNPGKKMLRLKARPKILLAGTYEKAWELYEKYKSNLLGVITDVEFPRSGQVETEAGLALTRRIKQELPDMPVLIQSSNAAYSKKSGEIGASFLNKLAPDIGRQIQNFIVRYFGFGDFVFTGRDGREISRAQDMRTLIELLKTVPTDSILYHAGSNHFSKWLFARSEFEIAYNLRPKKISEFKDGEELRKYLIETLHQFVYKTQLGAILKFDRKHFNADAPFTKIGRGSIGGKARGLAFVDFLMSKKDFSEKFPNTVVTVPNTVVIATDVFDFFLEQNNLNSLMSESDATEKTAEIFEKAELPDYITNDLSSVLDAIKAPLAVRSSSILEDSKTQPFAGIYKTYMLSNNHGYPHLRFKLLAKAIKYIYASTFSKEARAYRKFTPHPADEEKMAVILQKVVGRTYSNDRFYPLFSGILQSYNYYPVPPLSPDDPIAHIALGLGKTIVEGYNALRFSPNRPRNLHQFAAINDMLNNSQKKFMALSLKQDIEKNFTYFKEPDMETFDVVDAMEDGTLAMTGSVYSRENDMVYDSIGRPGSPVVTFAPILKNEALPLCGILNYLAEAGKDAMGCNIEMEFAVDYDSQNNLTEFNILQMRPMTSRSAFKKVNFENVNHNNIVCSSSSSLGNGYITGVSDIIFVKPETFNPLKTFEIASQINSINQNLKAQNKYYVLMGPGRWGSSDPNLGIPVRWDQISNSKVIIESNYEGFSVDPSYGTHFFHNVTSIGIGYLTINNLSGKGVIDWKWFASQNPVEDLGYVKHIRVQRPFDIRIDGSTGKGIIAI